MNYYDSLYGQQKTAVVMDKKGPSQTGEKIYVITCHDAEGQLLKLLQAVRDIGNCGHSFDIVVDPDAEKKTTIFWDGDGSDRISTITSTNAELDLRKVLLANLNHIKYLARRAIPDPDSQGQKPDDPMETLKKIENTCQAMLAGNGIDFGYGIKGMLDLFIENAKRYMKYCDTPPNETWTPKEGFEHMLWCFKHDYERMVKSQEVEMPETDKDEATSDGTTMDTATTDDATAKDGFFGLFNRSEAAKKGWETRKQNGWTPGVWPKQQSPSSPPTQNPKNPWAEKKQVQKEQTTQKADVLSVLPKHLTRQMPIRSEIDANREMAAAAQ